MIGKLVPQEPSGVPWRDLEMTEMAWLLECLARPNIAVRFRLGQIRDAFPCVQF